MKSINEQPSDRSIYVWNITGSIANALFSVVTLMIVTRILNEKQADIFSIAWTISQLMATIGTFQIRMYQATDIEGMFSFRQYYRFRIITIGIMILSSYVYILVRGYTGEKALVVMLVCLFRAVDSMADVYEGWFQQKERLDLSGKALTYRIIAATAGFGGVLLFTRNLLISCVVLLASYIICYFWFDIRYNRSVAVLRENLKSKSDSGWIIKMAVEGAPLFVNAFLIMSIMNTPKMVLDTAITNGALEQGAQTIFNILFMPASFLNLAYIVFRPLITQMAVMWSMGKRKQFIHTLLKILFCLFGMGIVILIGSAFLGIPVLSFAYAVDLSKYQIHLLVIVAGGCMYTFAAVLDNALVVIRRQYVLIAAYMITWVYIKAVAGIMVEKWGIMGSSMAYATAMVLFFAVMAVMFIVCFYLENGKQ